jgi:hypothetical protein
MLMFKCDWCEQTHSPPAVVEIKFSTEYNPYSDKGKGGIMIPRVLHLHFCDRICFRTWIAKMFDETPI